MSPEYIATAGILINLLFGGVIWFMKQSYTDLKSQVKEYKIELDHVKDKYYKKEDFRDFRDELWTRLDKMEIAWTHQLNELRK